LIGALDCVVADGSAPEAEEPGEPPPRNDEAALADWSSAVGRAEVCAPPETAVGPGRVGAGGDTGMLAPLIGAPIGTSGTRGGAPLAPAFGGAADAADAVVGARGGDAGALDGGTSPEAWEA
jgi:hypothetical protein